MGVRDEVRGKRQGIRVLVKQLLTLISPNVLQLCFRDNFIVHFFVINQIAYIYFESIDDQLDSFCLLFFTKICVIWFENEMCAFLSHLCVIATLTFLVKLHFSKRFRSILLHRTRHHWAHRPRPQLPLHQRVCRSAFDHASCLSSTDLDLGTSLLHKR